jgi:type III secretion system FlhB-like substrate exporter
MPAMRRIDTVRTRVCFPALAAAAVALMVLAGCSGSIAQDLLDPVEQARSAVRSDQLVLDLLAQERVTTDIAETVLKTMTDELISAEESINSTELSSQADEPVRDAALAAAREATSASVAGRDCLLQNSSCATAIEELNASAEALEEVLDQLESSR